MAQSTTLTTSTSDKQPFRDFTSMIQKERTLLDEKKRHEDEVKWLEQTFSLLTLTSSAPNLPAQTVAKAIEDRKRKIIAIVSQPQYT